MPHKDFFKQVFKEDYDFASADQMIDAIIEKYPYFSVAHFYKLKRNWENQSYTNRHTGLAALHFSNLYLLNKRLNEEIGTDYSSDITYPENEEKVIVDPTHQLHEAEIENITAAEGIVDNATGEYIENTAGAEATLANIETTTHEAESHTIGVAEEIVDNNKGKIVDNEDGAASVLAQTELASEDPVIELVDQHIEAGKPSEDDNNELSERLRNILQAGDHAPAATLSFEPLHSRDYFASQGIKISDEIPAPVNQSETKKSFTEWLRSMKKLNTSYKSDQERPLDPTVSAMADKSNLEEEVWTEPMAEALIMQGKTQKAIEVYEKLKLLNPSKIAYFAAKINNLK